MVSPKQAERVADSTVTADPATAISLARVRREFGDRAALRRIDLELPRGKTLAVLGPNGAGKSTLLRIVATLLRPTSGEVTVLGATLPRQAWKVRSRIGYLGHEPLLYRDLTIAENLRFHVRLHGLGSDGDDRAAELLDRVGMAARADELARNLSQGMAQRAAVCRALLHDPELLLLDEPYAHLDPEGAAAVEPLLAGAPSRTRVIVTHNAEAGIRASDAVLALSHRGEVAYAGTSEGLTVAELGAIYEGAVT